MVSLYFVLKAKAIWGQGNYQGDKAAGLSSAAGGGELGAECHKVPRLKGESEILRSLVVFFHGFAVTSHLFLLSKNNRCLGV